MTCNIWHPSVLPKAASMKGISIIQRDWNGPELFQREIMGNLPSHSKRALSTYSQTGQRTVNIKENKRKYTKGNTLLQASLTYVKLKKKHWQINYNNTLKFIASWTFSVYHRNTSNSQH